WHIHVRNDVLLQHEGKHEFHCKMEVQVSKDEDIVPIVDSLRRLYGANARVRVFRNQTMTVASGDFGGLGDVVFNLRDPKNPEKHTGTHFRDAYHGPTTLDHIKST